MISCLSVVTLYIYIFICANTKFKLSSIFENIVLSRIIDAFSIFIIAIYIYSSRSMIIILNRFYIDTENFISLELYFHYPRFENFRSNCISNFYLKPYSLKDL